LKKPEGGTVAGSLGAAGGIPARKARKGRKGWGAGVGNYDGRGSPMLDAL